MALEMKINVSVLEDTLGGSDAAQKYLTNLRTKKVMFLNGPESPGPCMRCLGYHRTIWNVSNFSRPIPPLHPHCYCRLVSYRTADQVKPLKKNEFLSKQISRLTMQQRGTLMGKGVARLHRLGIVETGDLVRAADGALTLEQHLARKLGITAKQFNDLSDGDLVKIFEAKNA